jgi:RimJ/RimL family protein N-acetyltransferase
VSDEAPPPVLRVVDVQLRPMRAEDVDAALDVFADVAGEGRWLGTEGGFDRTARRERFLAGIEDPNATTLLVEDPVTGRILGHGHVHVARYGVAELGMALAADARGRGIGGALLDGLLETARALGAHKVELQVWPHNEPAIRLYLSRGFAVEGRVRRHYRRSSGQRWDAVIMGLLLDEALAGEEPTLPDGTPLPDAPSLPPDRPREGPAQGPAGPAPRPPL